MRACAVGNPVLSRWESAGGAGGDAGGGSSGPGGGPSSGGRLNLLISQAGWDPDPWVDAIPAMLQPLGVRSLRVDSGREATEAIRREPIHIAVVDVGMPLSSEAPGESAGERLLALLSRLASPPPTVVLHRTGSAREDRRLLSAALRAGVYSVLERPRGPHEVGPLLNTLRQIIERRYAGRWPGCGAPGSGEARDG